MDILITLQQICKDTSRMFSNLGNIPFSYKSSWVKHSTSASEEVNNISSDILLAFAIVAPNARPGNI